MPGDIPPFMFRIVNASRASKTFVLEPWGDVYPLEAGGHVELTVQGPSPGPLEFYVDEEEITVYGWEGSIIEDAARNHTHSAVPPYPRPPRPER